MLWKRFHRANDFIKKNHWTFLLSFTLLGIANTIAKPFACWELSMFSLHQWIWNFNLNESTNYRLLITSVNSCSWNSFNLRNEWIQYTSSLALVIFPRGVKKKHTDRVINFFSRLFAIHKLWLFTKERGRRKNSRSMISTRNICTQQLQCSLIFRLAFFLSFLSITSSEPHRIWKKKRKSVMLKNVKINMLKWVMQFLKNYLHVSFVWGNAGDKNN